MRVFRKVYDVVVAESGVQALEILKTRTVDVAFVDYQMPGMDGAAVLAALAREHPTIVRYMLTGNADTDRMAELCAAGLCTRVLGKPWDRADIEAAMTEALARQTTTT
jgi:CheY-like chemotaxis protein